MSLHSNSYSYSYSEVEAPSRAADNCCRVIASAQVNCIHYGVVTAPSAVIIVRQSGANQLEVVT